MRGVVTGLLAAALLLGPAAASVSAAPAARTGPVCDESSALWHHPPTAREVRQLQCYLINDLTDYPGPVTGVLDGATLAALREFQGCDGLDPYDGIIGPRTQSELRRVYFSGVPVC